MRGKTISESLCDGHGERDGDREELSIIEREVERFQRGISSDSDSFLCCINLNPLRDTVPRNGILIRRQVGYQNHLIFGHEKALTSEMMFILVLKRERERKKVTDRDEKNKYTNVKSHFMSIYQSRHLSFP